MRDPLLTIPEACEYLRLGRSKVFDLLKRGEIKYLRQGPRRFVRESFLEDYLSRQPIVGRDE
jgi:excisionase family DNA binding protein